MSANQIESVVRLLYPTNPAFPPEFQNEALGLVRQSHQCVIGLKPTEEPARAYICTMLAAERYEISLNLPQPDITKSTVPPRTYKKLVKLFREALFPGSIQASSPMRRQKRAASAGTSTATQRRSSRTVTPTASAVVSPSKPRGDVVQDLAEIASLTDAALNIKTTTKAAPAKRKIVRGGPKSGDPRKSRVYELCREMGISDSATEAVIRSYKQYNNLVKDRWGLLCGIIVVITVKAHPRLMEIGTQGFYNKLIRISHTSMNQEKLDEWIAWSNRIINDQSWVKRVTDPRSREAHYRNKSKKYSSGIGNMITSAMSFSNEGRKMDYEQWCEEMRTRIKTQAKA